MTPQQLLQRYGPTAVVTGASSGIGRAFAASLAERGFDLVLVARREPVLRELADELSARHDVDVRVLPLDLAQPGSAEALDGATAEVDLGLYVAAAGFGTSGPFLDATLAQEREMLAVNCEVVLASTLLLSRRLAQRGRGGVVLLSSIVGFQGVANAAHYAATKGYVQALAEGLHQELARHGVDVLAVAPGPTESGFAERADMHLGATVSPREVAEGALRALGRRPTTTPGLLSRVLAGSLAPLPRRARVRVLSAVMAAMTRHQDAGTQASRVHETDGLG